jgi:hypothetical protein
VGVDHSQEVMDQTHALVYALALKRMPIESSPQLRDLKMQADLPKSRYIGCPCGFFSRKFPLL